MNTAFDFTVKFSITEGRFNGWSIDLDIKHLNIIQVLRAASTKMHNEGILSPVEDEDNPGEFKDYELGEDDFNQLLTASSNESLWESLGYSFMGLDLEDLLISRDEIREVISREDDGLNIWQAAIRTQPNSNISARNYRFGYRGKHESLEAYADYAIGQFIYCEEVDTVFKTFLREQDCKDFIVNTYKFDIQTGYVFG